MSNHITLTTELTKRGILCSHPVLGNVATIEPQFEPDAKGKWYVFPYAFPPYSHGKSFNSLQAAEFYALAIAYEMAETIGTTSPKGN